MLPHVGFLIHSAVRADVFFIPFARNPPIVGANTIHADNFGKAIVMLGDFGVGIVRENAIFNSQLTSTTW